MKKITIIGANSYIARNMYYMLSHRTEKYDIYLYDRTESHIDGGDNYLQIDILDPDSVKQICFECDVVFMFVGKTGSMQGFNEYTDFVNINEIALLNILNEYRKRESQAKIVFPSTRLVYKGNKFPIKEDDEKEYKTVYSVNKFACEKYLESFGNMFGVKYCIFRICIPYGTLIPGASSFGTAEFMLNKARNGQNISLYGDGSARRTVTFIGDLCEIFIRGGLSDKCINDTYNIGGENCSLLEFAKPIAEKYKVGIDFIPWPYTDLKAETGDTVFDDKKLSNLLDINYKMNYISWIKAEPLLPYTLTELE